MEHQPYHSLLETPLAYSTNLGLDRYEAESIHDKELIESMVAISTNPLIVQEFGLRGDDFGLRDEHIELAEYPRNNISYSPIPESTDPIQREFLKGFKSDLDSETPLNPRLSGWRTIVLTCAFTAIGVLIVNVILTIYGISKSSIIAGQVNIYNGDCSRASTISTTLHILINILSTILLGASNYTMQCLHSPTREQVDRAHGERKWLDIGIPSWRNRLFVSLRNRILWWGLAISSLPLHFLYNSVVFLDIAVQEYNVSFTNATLSQLLQSNQTIDSSANWQELSWQECESIYDRPFVLDHGDVIYVTPDVLGQHNETLTVNSTAQIYSTTYFPLSSVHYISWVKNQDQSHPYPQLTLNNTKIVPGPFAPADALNITPTYHYVKSCYSNATTSHCKLQFNIPIIMIVIICNLTKAICMFLAVLNVRDYPLVTLGDAIASFLEYADPTTRNMCLISKENIQKAWSKPAWPQKWKGVVEKGYYSVSPRRWMNVNLLFFAALIALVSGLIAGIHPGISAFKTGIGFSSSQDSEPTILSPSFGGPSSGSLQTIMLVNTPQVLVSLMNVLYNGLFTAIMLLEEWNSFSEQRKPLRVTVPVGEQKSNYYLTIPYRYAIPLLVLTGTFHWLISDSFFLVTMTAYKGLEIQTQDSIFGIGYSALAITLATLVRFSLIAILTFKSVQRFTAGMPVAGSCSAVISAMCHKQEGDESPQLKKVMWGVVRGSEELGSWRGEDGYGHCAFSSEVVAPPIPGRGYL